MKVQIFACSECGKTYGSRGALNRHANTHNGKVRFLCHICDTVYHRKDLLNRHYKTVHSSNDGSGRNQMLNARIRCVKACECCRERRIKCSGGNPCDSCVQKALDCTFSRGSKRFSVIKSEFDEISQSASPASSPSSSTHDRDGGIEVENNANEVVRVQLPDLIAVEDIWAETGDWSWVFDQSFQKLYFAPVASENREKIGSYKPDNPSDEECVAIIEEVIFHAMTRLTTNVLPESGSHPMENDLWYQLAGKVERHFGLSHWRVHSDYTHIFYYFMNLYFDNFHGSYPFFWRNGFEFSSVSPILCITLGMAGALFDRPCSVRFAQCLHEKLCLSLAGATLLAPEGDDGHASLLVSMLITQMVAIYSADPRRLHYAQQMSGVLVSQARRLNLFSPSGPVPQDISRWIRAETRKRVAFAIFLNESYLSILTATRPLVSAEELSLAMPCDNELWAYVGDEWQEKIHALMRADQGTYDLSFADLYRIVREKEWPLPNLQPASYRMLILALQVDVWKFSQDSELFNKNGNKVSLNGEIRRYTGSDMHSLLDELQRVHACLRKWKFLFSTDLQEQICPFDRQMVLSSRLTYHSYYLSMCAPMKELNTMADNFNRLTQLQRQRRLAIKWVKSQQSQSALYHVRAILDTLSDELKAPKEIRTHFNVAALICLHQCAVILWVCSGCTLEESSDIHRRFAIAGLSICQENSSALLCRISNMMLDISQRFGYMATGQEKVQSLMSTVFSPLE